MKNKKAKETIWHIIEWILVILVIVVVIFFIFKFDILNKIKDILPSFGK